MNRDKELSRYLQGNIIILEKSTDALKVSFKRCKKNGLKKEYNLEEFESFEALTSWFARAVDIFTQKILKSIPMILREEAITFIDRINFAEKIGVIESSDKLKILRDLRNEIAHDYASTNLNEIYKKVLDETDHLFSEINNCLKYISDHKLTDH